jgi:hypothetical protein
MNTGTVEGLLARLILEPSFLERVRADRQSALAGYAPEAGIAEALDSENLEKIQRFAGFIGKVQHNHLWDWFPATRSLLIYYKIELDLFTRYRTVQATPEWQRASRGERIGKLLDFIADYAAGNYPGLGDVVRHERAIWQTASETRSVKKPVAKPAHNQLRNVPWSVFQRMRPALEGIHILSFRFDPTRLTAHILAGEFAGKTPKGPRTTLAYVRGRSGEVRTLRTDDMSVYILGQVDGLRSVRSVIGRVRRDAFAGPRPSAFREFFEGAAEAGFIRMNPAGEKAA